MKDKDNNQKDMQDIRLKLNQICYDYMKNADLDPPELAKALENVEQLIGMDQKDAIEKEKFRTALLAIQSASWENGLRMGFELTIKLLSNLR